MSKDVTRIEKSALDVRLIEWDAVPFHSHPEIVNIWGPRDADALKKLIDEDGGIREPLRCARVKGLDGPPILFDGYTRLMIYFARKAEGKADTVPAYIVDEFDDLGQVLQKVLKVQASRRNVTVMQIADMALQIKAMQGFDISAKPTGRPKNESRLSSLIPLPSAKALAKEFGVCDRMIRIRQQARAALSPDDQKRMLAPLDSEDYLSPQQARNKIEGVRRETAKAAREKTIRDRRKKIEQMAVAANPDIVAPDGLYTIDATEGIKRISAGTVDLACTSIPYACDVPYDNAIPYDGDYPKFLDTYVRAWLTALKPVLKTGGRVAINFDFTYRLLDKEKAGREAHQVPHLFNLWTDISNIAERELGYLFMGYKTWYKQACSRQFAMGSRGSEMPMGNPNTEFILIFAKESMRLEGESDITEKEYDRFAVSHWFISPERRLPLDHPDYHPVPFPEEIPYRLIRMLCPKHGTVLDPFNGSGTTSFVAKALGRRFIGLDYSPLFTESASRRLAKLDGLNATERMRSIERFLPESEHGMEKHKKIRGVDPSQEDKHGDAGCVIPA
jgi:DNA modification methylase